MIMKKFLKTKAKVNASAFCNNSFLPFSSSFRSLRKSTSRLNPFSSLSLRRFSTTTSTSSFREEKPNVENDFDYIRDSTILVENLFKDHKRDFTYQEKHENQFHDFVIKLERVIKNESRRRYLNNKYINSLLACSVQSLEPVKDILSSYIVHRNENGYDPDVISKTLYIIGEIFQSRDMHSRAYHDIASTKELQKFYKWKELIENFKYAVSQEHTFLNGDQLATAIEGLAMCGYKDNEMIQLIINKLESMITGNPLVTKYDQNAIRYADMPSSGRPNFYAKYEGTLNLFKDKNFKDHISRLLMINDVRKSQQSKGGIAQNSEEKNADIQELSSFLKEVLSLVAEYKQVNSTIVDTIDNLLEQYYKIEQSLLSEPDLQSNNYIKYELFKLQDKLVEAGYLNHQTYNIISNKKLTESEFEQLKLRNSVEILHEFASFNFPDLININLNKLKTDLFQNIGEQFYEHKPFEALNLANLGLVLKSLTIYSKIINEEINGNDFFNKELNPKSLLLEKDSPLNLHEEKFISVCKDYTIFFKEIENFFKRSGGIIKERFSRKLEENKEILQSSEWVKGLGYVSYAFASMGVESPELSDFLHVDKKTNIDITTLNTSNITQEEYCYTIAGLAMTTKRTLRGKNLANKLFSNIDFNHAFNTREYIYLLWSATSLEIYKNEKFYGLLMKFAENLDHTYPLKPQEILMLAQLRTSIRHEVSKKINLPNSVLKNENLGVYNSQMKELYSTFKDNIYSLKRHIQSLNDPIRNEAITLIDRSIQGNGTVDSLNKGVTEFEATARLEELPYQPDIVCGYYGLKLSIFIRGPEFITTDTYKPNGLMITAKNHHKTFYDTEAIFISPEEIFDINLETLKGDIKENTTLHKIIERQLQNDFKTHKIVQIGVYFNSLMKSLSSTDSLEDIYKDIHQTEKTYNAVSDFFNSLIVIHQLNIDLKNTYLPNSLINRIQELKVRLIENTGYFNNLPLRVKSFVNSKVVEVLDKNPQASYEKFIGVITEAYNDYSSGLTKIKRETGKESLINPNWIGKRLDLDILLPEQSKISFATKSLSAELINYNYMWIKDYSNYSDWELQFVGKYDKLNYFATESKNKHLFNSHPLGNRNVPYGVFPLPNKIRKLADIPESLHQENLDVPKNAYEYELYKYKNYQRYLIQSELSKNKEISETIDPNTNLKVNLSNIKNSLKQNFTDDQIVSFLASLELTESLIEDIITRKIHSNTTLLDRGAKEFFEFHKKMLNSFSLYDGYDRAVMKEIHKNKTLLDTSKKLKDNKEGYGKINEELEEKVKTLIEETENTEAVAIFNPHEYEFVYDEESVLQNFDIPVKEFDIEHSTNFEDFLLAKRRKGERNLIMAKILHKVHTAEKNQVAASLTQNEKKYLQRILDECKIIPLSQIDQVGLGKSFTQLDFSHLNENDTYTLNTLPNVAIDTVSKDFGLSELVLELSLFIDDETVMKFIKEIYANVHKLNRQSNKKNQTYSDNNGFNIQNKEPTYINREVKETIWRISGGFNDEDKKRIIEFMKVKRGKSHFDKIWLDIDIESFNEFTKEANQHDNNLFLLEKWLKRKEREIQNRTNLPDKRKFTDGRVHASLTKKEIKRGEALLKQVFKVNDIDKVTRYDLSSLTNDLCTKLPLFNFEYPEEIVVMLNALLEAKNLPEEDKMMIKKYKLFFKVEQDNPYEYLAVKPIEMNGEKLHHYDENFMNESKILEKIQKSQVPLVQPMVTIMLDSLKEK